MGERERVQWSQEHRMHTFWFEKAVACAALIGGIMLVIVFRDAGGVGMYGGYTLAGAGLYGALPSLRPVFSTVVNRLPFLASKTIEEKAD